MKNNPLVKNAIGSYKENELIFASKLYREKLSNLISEAAYYKTLERMCKAGELVKIARGIYHLPKIGKYGIVPLSDREIASAFTDNGTGTVVGYSLYNALKLTTQISKTLNVMSSALESYTRRIRNVVIHQVQIEYSQEIINMINALEVLQNFNTIQNMDYSAFVNYSQSVAENYNEDILIEVVSNISYKKSTIAFLQEILKYYGVKNNLSMYLSALSEYNHPRMEEIYEIVRISKGV